LAVRRSPVSTLVNVTVTPAIEAPFGSATRPVNPVLEPVCAKTDVIEIAETILTTLKTRAIWRDTLLDFISASFCSLKLSELNFDCD
jgi:hypothetical protein